MGLLDRFNAGVHQLVRDPSFNRGIDMIEGNDPNRYGLLLETQKRTELDRKRQEAREREQARQAREYERQLKLENEKRSAVQALMSSWQPGTSMTGAIMQSGEPSLFPAAVQSGQADTQTALDMYKLQQKQSGFQGTGLEQQMLNIYLDPTVPDSAPEKRAAAQYLSKEKTIATPDGTTVIPGYDLAELRGGAASAPRTFVKKPLTADEKESGGFYERMLSANERLAELETSGYNPVTPGEVLGSAHNITKSSERQVWDQAASDWTYAKLRKESGAVLGTDEVRNEYARYFPMPGDKPEVLLSKARARLEAEKAMRTSSGAYEPRDRTPQTLEEVYKKYPYLRPD